MNILWPTVSLNDQADWGLITAAVRGTKQTPLNHMNYHNNDENVLLV